MSLFQFSAFGHVQVKIIIMKINLSSQNVWLHMVKYSERIISIIRLFACMRPNISNKENSSYWKNTWLQLYKSSWKGKIHVKVRLLNSACRFISNSKNSSFFIRMFSCTWSHILIMRRILHIRNDDWPLVVKHF